MSWRVQQRGVCLCGARLNVRMEFDFGVSDRGNLRSLVVCSANCEYFDEFLGYTSCSVYEAQGVYGFRDHTLDSFLSDLWDDAQGWKIAALLNDGSGEIGPAARALAGGPE